MTIGFLVRWNPRETIRACTTGLVTLDEHMSASVKDGFPETTQLLALIDRHFGLEELRSADVKERYMICSTRFRFQSTFYKILIPKS